jgi:predicted dehydrogenase
MSRRQMLSRSAALAAAGLGVPLIIPSGVLGAPGRPGANDRIGIGGIGVGRQGGDVFLGAARHKLGRPVAVADVNLPRALALAGKLQIDAYQDFRRLLDRKDVDAITTATPDHWRSLVCILACQAGKDIYAEKPMTLLICEGRLMVEAVRKYRRVFQTGSQQRSGRPSRVGCALVRSGAFGKIKRVLAHNYPSPWECRLPAQPILEGLDWDFWCGPTEVVPYHIDLYTPRARPGWISYRPYSGGEMTGWGAHGLDEVQWALGMDESGPIEIWTEGKKFQAPVDTGPCNKAQRDRACSVPRVFFRYPGDIIVELGNGPAGGATFFGEKGKITIDRSICQSDPPEIAAEALKKAAKESENHIQNWLECILSRARPRADVEIGHRSATLCHLGHMARWIGRRLRWDPVKEIFPGDPEANAYLDRPRRHPYQLPQVIYAKSSLTILATGGDLTQARRASEGDRPSLARRACVKPVRGPYN